MLVYLCVDLAPYQGCILLLDHFLRVSIKGVILDSLPLILQAL